MLEKIKKLKIEQVKKEIEDLKEQRKQLQQKISEYKKEVKKLEEKIKEEKSRKIEAPIMLDKKRNFFEKLFNQGKIKKEKAEFERQQKEYNQAIKEQEENIEQMEKELETYKDKTGELQKEQLELKELNVKISIKEKEIATINSAKSLEEFDIKDLDEIEEKLGNEAVLGKNSKKRSLERGFLIKGLESLPEDEKIEIYGSIKMESEDLGILLQRKDETTEFQILSKEEKANLGQFDTYAILIALNNSNNPKIRAKSMKSKNGILKVKNLQFEELKNVYLLVPAEEYKLFKTKYPNLRVVSYDGKDINSSVQQFATLFGDTEFGHYKKLNLSDLNEEEFDEEALETIVYFYSEIFNQGIIKKFSDIAKINNLTLNKDDYKKIKLVAIFEKAIGQTSSSKVQAVQRILDELENRTKLSCSDNLREVLIQLFSNLEDEVDLSNLNLRLKKAIINAKNISKNNNLDLSNEAILLKILIDTLAIENEIVRYVDFEKIRYENQLIEESLQEEQEEIITEKKKIIEQGEDSSKLYVQKKIIRDKFSEYKKIKELLDELELDFLQDSYQGRQYKRVNVILKKLEEAYKQLDKEKLQEGYAFDQERFLIEVDGKMINVLPDMPKKQKFLEQRNHMLLR